MESAQLSRRTLLAGLAALAAAPLAACGSSSSRPASSGPALRTAKDVSWTVPPAGAPVDAIAEGMAAFAYALCRATSAGKNWVASPASISIAFAMARAGAAGATAASLDRFFGFPANGRDDAFNALIRGVQTVAVPPKTSSQPVDPSKPPSPPIIAIGDALFPAKSTQLNPAFLRTLAAQYGTGVRPVDFTTPAAVDEINAWVSVQTAGRITKVWDSLDPSTTLVLANTVYLKADWQHNFMAYPVTQKPFMLSGGSSTSVSMMFQPHLTARHWADPSGVAALELPFAGKGDATDLAMWIMLPRPGDDPAGMLAPAMLRQVAAKMTATDVQASVPKWDFASELDLGTVLVHLGLDHVFGDGDFSGIGPNIGALSSAIHKANITVDQYGTEAAATTDLDFASGGQVAPALEFRADRPFAFSVVSGTSYAPLFSGVVANPRLG
jgi:serpin B